jgi:hypothetical protein
MKKIISILLVIMSITLTKSQNATFKLQGSNLKVTCENGVKLNLNSTDIINESSDNSLSGGDWILTGLDSKIGGDFKTSMENIRIKKASLFGVVKLESPGINIENEFEFISGDFDLNGVLSNGDNRQVNLGFTGKIVGETESKRFIDLGPTVENLPHGECGGEIVILRDWTTTQPNEFNISGSRISITSPINMGITTIKRGQVSQPSPNILGSYSLYHKIIPEVNNNLNATVSVQYLNPEKFGTGFASIFKANISPSGCSEEYSNIPPLVSDFNNVTISGINNFSIINLGEEDPLPVSLLGFWGECDGDDVKIFWTTISEINSNSFIVEKSNDLVNWKLVSSKISTGFSNQLINYSITDRYEEDYTYYKLTEEDNNGIRKELDIFNLECDGNGLKFDIFPNPNFGKFNITTDMEEYLLEIITSDGRTIVFENVFEMNKYFDLKLESSMYLVKITNNYKSKTKRMIIIK